MMKTISICIVGILLFTTFGAVAQSYNIENNNSNLGEKDFTHTIFAELGTATWCGYCHFARESLDKICTSQDYPFYYVSLVDDMNTHSADRNSEFNIYGFPTVFFDYGYQVVVGGWSGAEAAHRAAINECGKRTVADIDINLDVEWLGDATMDISIDITNNDDTPYSGHLHVYVCELESSLGWKDTTGHNYTYPFLDYAFNEPISIDTGDTWIDTITWDGHNYNSGLGQDFGSIQFGNIAIIASVFNSEWHQGYANPPSGNPFNAYWADETEGVILAEPNMPSNPDPVDKATNIDINKKISWIGGGAPGDIINYDIYFGTESTPQKVATIQKETIYDPGILSYSTTYYWKIVASNNYGISTEGPIWSFTTVINSAPDKPTITGPDGGKPGEKYFYQFVTTDPENDDVYYYVDWGDGNIDNWFGPYASGEKASARHSWDEKGTYIITVKAKDSKGVESDITTLTVTMPRNKIVEIPLIHILQKLLENRLNRCTFLQILLNNLG